MKHLVELTKIEEGSKPLPQIYCDMDMVICDFIGGYEQLTGKDFAKTDKEDLGRNQSKEGFLGEHLIGTSQRMWKLINKYQANILSAYSNRDANNLEEEMVVQECKTYW